MNSVLCIGSHVESSMNALDQPPAVPDLAVLIERIAGGDTAALSAFYDATCRDVYNMALLWVDDVASAEQILLETFFEVRWRALTYRQHPCPPLLWVMLIASTIALDEYYDAEVPAPIDKPSSHAAFYALSDDVIGERGKAKPWPLH